jgi:nucleoside-diphosphate-sugar epimerase
VKLVPVVQDDLSEILKRAEPDLRQLKGARIFVTGGTGYIGRWMVASLLHANDALGLGARLVILTRDAKGFAEAAPQIAGHEAVSAVVGDIRSFDFPEGAFSHVLHGATDVLAINPPVHTYDVCVDGSRRVLDFCVDRKVARVLMMSSGAVYGPCPDDATGFSENMACAIDTALPDSAYGLGKLTMEWLGKTCAAQSGLHVSFARIFAQIGPGLALDKHFAAGNFIANALAKQPFVINGDGTPLRTYMYATDLVVWLLRILAHGQKGQSYNVGSDQSVSIAELAGMTAQAAGVAEPQIVIKGVPEPGAPRNRYIPDVRRAQEELGLAITVPLDVALKRTIAANQAGVSF